MRHPFKSKDERIKLLVIPQPREVETDWSGCAFTRRHSIQEPCGAARDRLKRETRRFVRELSHCRKRDPCFLDGGADPALPAPSPIVVLRPQEPLDRAAAAAVRSRVIADEVRC